MSVRTLPIPVGSLILAAATIFAQRAPQLSWSPVVERVSTPAATDSAQPQLSMSNRGIILSWIERSGERATLKYSEWTAGWSTSRAVASGTDWFVNWADVPSVIRLANGTLVSHWLQKSGPETYAYDVRLSSSRDEGRTWSPSFMPYSDASKTEHGFASLFQMPGAGLGVAWLDGRTMTAQPGHNEHAAGGGAMSVRFAMFDNDWKQLAETPVDLRVCDCCPTAAALTDEGPILAFRNRTDDEIRDIYIARCEQGRWSEPRPVYDDAWKITACPVNGPMLSARNREVAIAWFTVREEQGRAFVAFSDDAGRTFGSPIRIDDGKTLGRVDVELMPDGSAIASWIEVVDKQAQFRVRRVEHSGVTSPAVTVADLVSSRASGYPRIATHGDDLVFAWTDATEGRTQVQTAVARVAAARAQ